ncbi:MAG: OmpA family protein [Byssovorax sp.]
MRAARLLLPALLALSLAGAGCAGASGGQGKKKYEAPDERFVFFSTGQITIAPEGYFGVGYTVALLESDPSFHVLVVGHADQRGKADQNKELSLKRARVVRRALLDHGVKAERILIGVPRDGNESTVAELGRRVDLFVYDPLQEEASNRLGYPLEIKSE